MAEPTQLQTADDINPIAFEALEPLSLECVPWDSLDQVIFTYNGDYELNIEVRIMGAMDSVMFTATDPQIGNASLLIYFWMEEGSLIGSYTYLERQTSPTTMADLSDSIRAAQKEKNRIFVRDFPCPIPTPWDGYLPGTYVEVAPMQLVWLEKMGKSLEGAAISSPAKMRLKFKTASW